MLLKHKRDIHWKVFKKLWYQIAMLHLIAYTGLDTGGMTGGKHIIFFFFQVGLANGPRSRIQKSDFFYLSTWLNHDEE